MRAPAFSTLSLGLLLTSPSFAQVLYGTGGPELFTINPANAAETTVETTVVGGATVFLTALAFNPADGQMYCSIGNDSQFSKRIGTINLATAEVTVKPTVNPWPIPDMKFGPNGQLYGIRKQGSTLALVSINITTGAATQIGSGITLNSAGNAFAISPAGVAYVLTGDKKLRTIDLTTGVFSAGITLTNTVFNPNTLFPAAAFSPNGTLFATEGGDDCCGPGRLDTINTSTGAVTTVGVESTTLDGLSFNFGVSPAAGPSPGPAGAPISPFAIALIAVGLLVLAARRLQFRAQ